MRLLPGPRAAPPLALMQLLPLGLDKGHRMRRWKTSTGSISGTFFFFFFFPVVQATIYAWLVGTADFIYFARLLPYSHPRGEAG